MKFLLTNDDGVQAPGLAALRRAVESLAPTVVVAPDQHLSGCSHQVTTTRPLALETIDPLCFALDGSPVDCARVGLLHLYPDTSWVLSGVNDGGNLGTDVYVSGTVAAAREACLLGRPAIAISQYVRGRPIDWERAARWTRSIVEMLIERPLRPDSFWNVNLPQPEANDGELPQIVFCAADPNPLAVRYELIDGKLHFKARYRDRPRKADHDVEHCFAGKITISQIGLWRLED